MRAFLLVALIGFWSCYSLAFANVEISDEGATLHRTANSIEMYRTINGRLPMSWEEIIAFQDPRKGSGMYRQGYQINERYQFVEQPVALSGIEGSRILLIRTVPLRKTVDGKEELYRYFIYETGSGIVNNMSAGEGVIRAMFETAGVELPKAEVLPASETEDSSVTSKSLKDEAITSTGSQPQVAESSATLAAKFSPADAKGGFFSWSLIILLAIVAVGIIAVLVFFWQRKGP